MVHNNAAVGAVFAAAALYLLNRWYKGQSMSITTQFSTKQFNSATFMIIGSSMVRNAYDIKHFGFGIYLADWYSRLVDILLRGTGGYNR